jgi:hypothetical protein
MYVIGAGFGRTGTTSTKAALELLGFAPCYHMLEVIVHPPDVAHWRAAVAGRPVDWRQFFRNYRATVDWPACEFYQELMAVYPDAKVLLNVRDPERWYDSMASTIYPLNMAVPHWLRRLVPHLDRFLRLNMEMLWQGRFGGRFEDRNHAIEVYTRHVEEVKRVVPPERLLVFDVKEGWEPLCRFLGVPVPTDQSFPHLNDAAQVQVLIRAFRTIGWLGPVLAAGLLLGVGAGLYRRMETR